MRINSFTPQTNFYLQTNSEKNNIAFCGVPTQFSKELKNYVSGLNTEKTVENNLIKMFKEMIPKIVKPENFQGAGEYGAVYKIDDEFVIKKLHKQKDDISGFELNENPLLKKFKTFYGEYVAKVNGVKILKNAATSGDTVNAGVKDGLEHMWEKMNYYRDIYLKRFTALPQEAFDDVASDFKTVYSMNRSFDTINPNNFIADGKRIKILDDLVTPNDKFFNSLAGMVKVFITSLDRNTRADFDVLAVGSRRNLLRKIILAGEKNELNFGSSMAEKEELNHALALCDIQTPWRDVQADLCNLRRRYPNMGERLKKVDEYISELEDYSYNPFMD